MSLRKRLDDPHGLGRGAVPCHVHGQIGSYAWHLRRLQSRCYPHRATFGDGSDGQGPPHERLEDILVFLQQIGVVVGELPSVLQTAKS